MPKRKRQHKPFFPHEIVLLGLSILLSGVIIGKLTFQAISWQGYSEILWYCNCAALILGISVILKNKALIGGVLLTAIPAQFVWILDFFLEIAGQGLGRTAWLFQVATPFEIAVTTFVHAAVIPLAVYAAWHYGIPKKSYLAGLFFVLILLPASFFWGSYEQNTNCMFYSCDTNIEEVSAFHNTTDHAVKQVLYWFVMLLLSFSVIYPTITWWRSKTKGVKKQNYQKEKEYNTKNG